MARVLEVRTGAGIGLESGLEGVLEASAGGFPARFQSAGRVRTQIFPRLRLGNGQRERGLGTVAELFHRLRDVLLPEHPQDRDRQVGERRQRPRQVPLARPAGVFLQHAVAHPMHAVLDRPPVAQWHSHR